MGQEYDQLQSYSATRLSEPTTVNDSLTLSQEQD